MSKNNNDFFKTKKEWSIVKDDLLACYLKPYISKILTTHKPIVYIDCFAGKGKFDSGDLGSPLIALDTIKDCLSITKLRQYPRISAKFIEPHYTDDLRNNIKDFTFAEVVSGKYEDKIEELLEDKDGDNVFLYIDPYGIKELNYSVFNKLSQRRFNSLELLLNLNSFGFFRYACSALGASLKDEDFHFFDNLVEYDTSKIEISNGSFNKSIQTLNNIAGGEYWQTIIELYRKNEINAYQAEEQFVTLYCQHLKQDFKYVLNMPIRIKEGNPCKYHMVHATNHVDGCLLMANNINKRWELMRKIQTNGQLTLWQEDINNQIIDPTEIKNKVREHYKKYKELTPLNLSLAEFFVNNGVICSIKEVKDFLRKFEKDEIIIINRDPQKTRTGKESTFMNEDQQKKVYLKWNES